MDQRQPVPSQWTARDSALWHTCEIAVDLAGGDAPRPQLEVVATFPPQLHDAEQFWASGSFLLLEERSAGDGTYMHDSGYFFATGRGGLTATAAVATFRAVGNARRRRAAERDAVLRWTPVDQGIMYVSAHGVTLHTGRALLPWAWSSISTAQMVGPAMMHLLGDSINGPVSWILQSDWAELAFVTWALARHRRHPQLLNGGWLPPGWLEHCAQWTYSTRLASPVLGS